MAWYLFCSFFTFLEAKGDGEIGNGDGAGAIQIRKMANGSHGCVLTLLKSRSVFSCTSPPLHLPLDTMRNVAAVHRDRTQTDRVALGGIMQSPHVHVWLQARHTVRRFVCQRSPASAVVYVWSNQRYFYSPCKVAPMCPSLPCPLPFQVGHQVADLIIANGHCAASFGPYRSTSRPTKKRFRPKGGIKVRSVVF